MLYYTINFTGHEEEEERGGNIQKLGYLFYRDYGNEMYGYFLRMIAMKGCEDGNITKTEFDSIAKYNNVNMGNILEAITGYAWIYNYKKESRVGR
eukprot:6567669-Heterocapsa_arctica.AAC.1